MHNLENGKILVTGGAGFIGSALVWALNQRGLDNILVSDLLEEDEKFKNLIPLRFDDYMEGDDLLKGILNAPSSDYFKEIKTVFHLGACSSTTEKDCRYLIKNNYEYTKRLATWALSNEARFVYASSAATYGNGDQGMNDLDPEIQKLRPLNMYGYSKHLFDLHAKKEGILDSIVGLKYFNVFGPNEHHKDDMRSVVHKAFHQIQEEGGISKLFKSYHPDYKDGEQMRDFLYVKDAINMTLHLAESDANGLYNLGSGEANTWLTLVRSIFQALDKSENIEFIEMPEYLKPKYQYYTKANIDKLRNTGYTAPVTPLPDAVKDYVQNYLACGKYLGDEAEVEEPVLQMA